MVVRTPRLRTVRSTQTFRRHPVLGTNLEVTATLAARETLRLKPQGNRNSIDSRHHDLETTLVQEIERLESIFSAYRPTSEFCSWRIGDASVVSAELGSVLGSAWEWQRRSLGSFNPAVGQSSQRWHQAEREQLLPTDHELDTIAQSLREPRFHLDPARLRIDKVGDCSTLNLNAIAKGFIVDRAIDHTMSETDATALVVNIGGDLAHRGEGSVRVGVENPLYAYDNVPPLVTVELSNASIATSGSAERGWRIKGRWFSHVIDPRTARPVDHIVSASVIAPSAMDADAAATAYSVLTAEERSVFSATLDSAIAFCIVDADGAVHTNAAWEERVV